MLKAFSRGLLVVTLWVTLFIYWSGMASFSWFLKGDVTTRGSFLISYFKVFLHTVVIGWTETWSQFFWLVEGSMCLLRGAVACCVDRVRDVFVTGFLISNFFSHLSHDPDSFLLPGSVLVSFSLLFSNGPKYWILIHPKVLWFSKQLIWSIDQLLHIVFFIFKIIHKLNKNL